MEQNEGSISLTGKFHDMYPVTWSLTNSYLRKNADMLSSVFGRRGGIGKLKTALKKGGRVNTFTLGKGRRRGYFSILVALVSRDGCVAP